MKNRAFTILFITIFIDFLSFGIVFPLLPYYVERFSSSALVIGLISAGFSLMQFIFAPLWGRFSDHVGRKPIILISLLGTALSLVGFAMAPSLLWLFISRLLAGFFTAASLPTTYDYVADYTKEEERAEKFGMLGAAWGLGFIFGPALGGFLSTISVQTPFFVAGAIAFINFIFSYFFLPVAKKPVEVHKVDKEGLMNIFLIVKHLRSDVGLLFILFFLAAFTLSGLEIIFPLFTQMKFGFNETNIGFFFTLIGITIGFTQGVLVGKLVKKLGDFKTIVIAHICMIIGYTALVLSPNIILLCVSGVILAMGIALNEPTLAALISKK
jgi:multidrug resistance protein